MILTIVPVDRSLSPANEPPHWSEMGNNSPDTNTSSLVAVPADLTVVHPWASFADVEEPAPCYRRPCSVVSRIPHPRTVRFDVLIDLPSSCDALQRLKTNMFHECTTTGCDSVQM
jgi:hypothetical protein